MIPVSRLAVLTLISLIGLIGLPVAFADAPSTFSADLSLWAPIVFILEIVLYFALTLFTISRLKLSSVILVSVLMAGLRAVASLVGCSLYGLLHTGTEEVPSILQFWVGNPLLVILPQMVILMFAGPHILEALAPDSVDKDFRVKLGGGEPSGGSGEARGPIDASPTGGFYQVFSYEELAAQVKKTSGLEGFVICSQEGLIVWRDLPLRLDLDELAARLMSNHRSVSDVMMNGGLTRVRKVVVESRDHTVVISELNQNFGLVLVFNSRTRLAECEARIGLLAKTVREFLQWKYPGLSVRGSLASQTAVEVL